jgi:hypothetical protein
VADSTLYDGAAKTRLNNAISTYSATTFTAPSAVQAAVDDLKASGDALLNHKSLLDTYLSSLMAANTKKTAYASTKYNQVAPFQKLVQKINLYGTIGYTDDALLKLAGDSLNFYATLTPNWVNNAIPALTYRINKAVALAEKVGVESATIEPGRNALTDDNTVVGNLNEAIKSALTVALSNGSLTFGKSSDNPAYTDSLEMTSFIKNPNFYTSQTAAGLSGTTFTGWSVPTANASTDVGPDVLATPVNPFVDTDAKVYNSTMARFEQAITGLPAGVYNIYMKTRVPANSTLTNTFIFYALVTGSDTLKAEFRKGALTERVQTGFQKVRISDGNLKIGVRVGAATSLAPTLRWGDPTLWMVSDVISGLDELGTQASVKEVQYYTIMGQRTQRPTQGLNIVKTLYDNGKVKIQKVLFK